MIDLQQPLVSIIVITYNSSKYVIETLESAKEQTYQNIELLVSDDCSTDNTVEICKDWIEKNKERFVRVELIAVEKNTGISANCNRGLFSANGEWVKLVAGDDILVENAIEILVKEVIKNKEINFLFGGCQFLTENGVNSQIELPTIKFTEMNAYNQFLFLIIKGNRMHGPTSFINKKKLIELSGYDERIPFSEDWPLWIKATKENNKLYFTDKNIALYRIHSNGIYSKTKVGFKYDSILNKSVNLIRKYYLLPNLLNEKKIFNFFHQWIIYNKEMKTSKRVSFLFKLLLLISPVFYKNKFSK